MPFVLAFAVSKTDVLETDATETDVPETDGAETDAPETDVPETEEGGDRGRSRRRDGKVCCWCSFSTLWIDLVYLNVSLSLMIAVVCVGGWLGGCVWVRVEERIAQRACFVLGYRF